jgi:putative transposase
VRPAVRREVVHYLRMEWRLAERRSCGLVGISRSGARYVSSRGGDEELRERLRQLAAARRRFGYRRLHVLLRREGEVVNHKRVYRLYREEACPCASDVVREWPRKHGCRSRRQQLRTGSGVWTS